LLLTPANRQAEPDEQPCVSHHTLLPSEDRGVSIAPSNAADKAPAAQTNSRRFLGTRADGGPRIVQRLRGVRFDPGALFGW